MLPQMISPQDKQKKLKAHVEELETRTCAVEQSIDELLVSVAELNARISQLDSEVM